MIPKETMKEVMGGLMGAITEGLKGKKTEDGKDHDGNIKDFDDELKKEIDKAADQDAQTSEYLSVTCFEDGWPSSVLKQNKSVMVLRKSTVVPLPSVKRPSSIT